MCLVFIELTTVWSKPSSPKSDQQSEGRLPFFILLAPAQPFKDIQQKSMISKYMWGLLDSQISQIFITSK